MILTGLKLFVCIFSPQKVIVFISLFLAVLCLCSWEGFSLHCSGGGYSLVAVPGLPIVVASVAAEHGV